MTRLLRFLNALTISSLAVSMAACGGSSDDPAARGAAGTGIAGEDGSHAGATNGGAPASASAGGGGVGPASAGTGGPSGGGAGPASAGTGSSSGAGGSAPATPVADYAMASSARGSCALDSSGNIQCWGYAPAEWPIPAGQFLELHGSIDAICGVRADHAVVCFDAPDGGESGIADLVPTTAVQSLVINRGTICGTDGSSQAFCNSAYPQMDVPVGEDLSRVAAGFHFACGIRSSDASITCWGYGGADPCSGIPAAGQLTPPSGAFVSLSTNYYSSCAIDRAGSVACWGAGKATDDPNAMCPSEPYNFGQSVPPAGSFRSVEVGFNHACGVKADGSIACWGAGKTSEDGCPGTECGQSQPPAGEFIQVSVGSYHSCAMTAERKIKCWGYASAGRTQPPAAFQ